MERSVEEEVIYLLLELRLGIVIVVLGHSDVVLKIRLSTTTEHQNLPLNSCIDGGVNWKEAEEESNRGVLAGMYELYADGAKTRSTQLSFFYELIVQTHFLGGVIANQLGSGRARAR